jgi:hypothetical protein
VTRLTAIGSHGRVLITTDQAATVRWRLASGRTSVSGRARSRAQRSHAAGKQRFDVTVALPLGGRRGLRPGRYRLTATASDSHGAGRSRSVLVTVTP